MKRLVLSAILALSILAIPVQPANAGGFGFNASVGISCSFNCSWNCCGCGPSYGYGGCFAPAYCGMGGYGPAIGSAPYGYPGYPGVAYGYGAADYGTPPAAPAYAPQATMPQAQPVGYYPQAGYGNYAVPAYWYGR